MPNKDGEVVNQRTLTRRTLLEWLGAATVFGLGGELLAACSSDQTASVDARPSDGNLGLADLQWHPDRGVHDGGITLPFQPGESLAAVYQGWGERTVDPQDLTWILSHWQLKVTGLVEKEAIYTFRDLLGLPGQSQITDFHCVEGWSVYDVPWNGVHLKTILAAVKPKSTATYITFHTIGSTYNESLPLNVALEPHTMLAFGVDEATLPLAHGFPLRVVIPRLFGYKNAKYVEALELTDRPIDGYWVKVGYPYGGEVPADRLRAGKY
jgi:DMSO/TMAO reductase YedYZ molybdopterin-dependent catalytic subunit